MRNIRVSFGGVHAVDNVSVDLHAGEVVGLVVGLVLRPRGVEGGRDGEEDGGGGGETKDLQGSPRRAMNSACTSAKVRKPSRIQPFTVGVESRPA